MIGLLGYYAADLRKKALRIFSFCKVYSKLFASCPRIFVMKLFSWNEAFAQRKGNMVNGFLGEIGSVEF